jgi:hypothetical protein
VIVDAHGGSEAGETPGDGASDAARGTGDEGDLAGEVQSSWARSVRTARCYAGYRRSVNARLVRGEFLALDASAISLGQMLTNTVQFARTAWWVAVFPGLAITLFVFAFSLLGEALNDAISPEASAIGG